MASARTRFAVMGTGNVGHALAGHLALRGFQVNIAELPPFAARLGAIRKRGGIEVEGVAGEGLAVLARVTDDLGAAVADVDVVFVSAPAYGHEAWCRALAPHLASGQFVVLISCFGALRARDWLASSGAVPVELMSSPFPVRAPEPGRVVITGIKQRLPVAALPASQTAAFLDKVADAFPQMTEAADVVDTSLNNLNPVVHVPMMMFNIGRIESADPASWTLYGDGATESVVKIMQAIDEDRLAVARTAGVAGPSFGESFATFYPGLDKCAGGLSASLRTSAAHANPTLGATDSMDYRYVTEDIPFGLAPWASLGAAWGVATPTLDSLVQLYGVISAGTDVCPPLSAADLNADGTGPDALRRAVA